MEILALSKVYKHQSSSESFYSLKKLVILTKSAAYKM
jgi:hypothetical protein